MMWEGSWEEFRLDRSFVEELRSRPVAWGFPVLSEFVFLRTYSRRKEDGSSETWADTVIRVVEGVLSIRKTWYRIQGIAWDDSYWRAVGEAMAESMFAFEFLPAGRGLWAQGTETVRRAGSAALNNCCFISIIDPDEDLAALMDFLMLGVGVGFSTHECRAPLYRPDDSWKMVYEISDDREGWVESVKLLIRSYLRPGHPRVEFDYGRIRPAGSPIRGFGGVASGPEPLRKLHERIRSFLDRSDRFDSRLVTDLANAIGACVVAGNVRRSAEIALGLPNDEVFLDLKDYEKYPERAEIGWLSNNSVILSSPDDFAYLPAIAERVVKNGEPGVFNLMNVRKYGRYTEKRPDHAVGVNPCAEIPLESYELCNLVELFPIRMGPDADAVARRFPAVAELAAIYGQTVSLLPTHRERTNAVIARNRRVGISVSGVADWVDRDGLSKVVRVLNHGYDIVQETLRRLAADSGVPVPVRSTTVKPSGTISLLAGVSPGCHYPEGPYVIRRVRISDRSPLVERLRAAGIPSEPDAYSEGTLVFEFPVQYGSGRTRSIREVSIWEQAALVALLQRFWADNAVSNTLKFQPDEVGEVERVLVYFVPQTKSLSLLPDRPDVYPQMPIERIDEATFRERFASIRPFRIDGSGSDGIGSRFCDGDSCEL